MVEKCCPRCRAVKPDCSFHVDNSKQDGRASYCKQCASFKAKEWYNSNKPRANAYSRNWILRNPEKRKEISRKYNRHAYATRGEEYREKARDRSRAARALFLRQAGAYCTCCGFKDRTDILQFDHIVPVKRNSKNLIKGFINWACSTGLSNSKVWDEFHRNIQVLCPNCHAVKTLDDNRVSA